MVHDVRLLWLRLRVGRKLADLKSRTHCPLRESKRRLRTTKRQKRKRPPYMLYKSKFTREDYYTDDECIYTVNISHIFILRYNFIRASQFSWYWIRSMIVILYYTLLLSGFKYLSYCNPLKAKNTQNDHFQILI